MVNVVFKQVSTFLEDCKTFALFINYYCTRIFYLLWKKSFLHNVLIYDFIKKNIMHSFKNFTFSVGSFYFHP